MWAKSDGLRAALFGLLAACGITACGSVGQPASVVDQPVASGITSFQSGLANALPDLQSLPVPRGASAIINQDSLQLVPEDAVLLSEGCSISGDGSLLIDPGEAQFAYAIFRFGDLLPNDQVVWLTAETVTPSAFGSIPGAYYLLLADYSHQCWQVSTVMEATGMSKYTPPVTGGCVSPSACSYAAILVPHGQQARLYTLSEHYDLSGRNIDHLYSEVPTTDSAGVDIALWLEARDGTDAIDYSFNGSGTITSLPPGVEVVGGAGFTNGWMRPLLRFSAVGDYELRLSSSIPALNGTLGSIHIYSTQLPVYSLHIDNGDWNHLKDVPDDKTDYPGTLSIDGGAPVDVGLHFRGNSSLWLPKKSWKVSLPAGAELFQPWLGYAVDEMNLNSEQVDPTMMREMLSYRLMEDMGVLAPRARFIHLRVNDGFQGLYVDVEEPDKRFLRSRGVSDAGAMYKPVWNTMEVVGGGTGADYVGVFDKKTRKVEPFDDLAQLIGAVNSWPGADCDAQFKATFDEERFLNYMVANSLISQGDHMGKNYILYHDDVVQNEWIVIPWDHDLTWGHHYTETYGLFCEPMFYDTPLDMGGFSSSYLWRGTNNLLDKYVYEPVLSSEFKSQLAVDLQSHFGASSMLARIDQYYDLVLDDALADPMRWQFGSYEERVQELRDYVVLRRAFLSAELSK